MIKLDLKFADKSRIGPIAGQVVFRGDNGVVALRLLDVPEDIRARYDAIKGKAQAQEDSLLQAAIQTGKVILVEEHSKVVLGLQAEIDALRNQLAVLKRSSVN